MAITKCETPVDNITKIGTTAFDRKMTTSEFKAEFDKSVTGIKGFLNDSLIRELESVAEDSSGADKIGATPLKEGGAETTGGQLKELHTEKVDKIPGKGLSSNDFKDEDVQALANKVDKISGKGLSTNDFTETYKTKLDSIEENANNYKLPIASTTVVGGVKAGVSIEILPDGTINGLSAPAPDYPARESIAQEIIDRQNADQALSDRIDTEESTRAGADTNLQNQITTNKNAVNVNISETARTLYGLSAGDANVDKALQGVWNKTAQSYSNHKVEYITSSKIWTAPAGVTEVSVYLVDGGKNGNNGEAKQTSSNVNGGAGGDGGKQILIDKLPVAPSQQIQAVVGTANGGVSSFLGLSSAIFSSSSKQQSSASGNITVPEAFDGTIIRRCPLDGKYYGVPGANGGTVTASSTSNGYSVTASGITRAGGTGGIRLVNGANDTLTASGGGASANANGDNGTVNGSVATAGNGANASANTGNGGGGGGSAAGQWGSQTRIAGSGGTGGSGIIILRYLERNV